MNNNDADFQIDGAETLQDCPTRFQIQVVRYEDGKTLDSFARSLGAVYKTRLAGVWVVQEELGPRSFGAGGRFRLQATGIVGPGRDRQLNNKSHPASRGGFVVSPVAPDEDPWDTMPRAMSQWYHWML